MKKPPDLIPENKMANILKDMNLVKVIVTERRNSGLTQPSEQEYYKAVFQHYGVSPKQVRQSLDYYNLHKEIMTKIYDLIISDYTHLQDSLYLEEQLKTMNVINNQGLFNYEYKKQWFYPDSIPALIFRPVF